MIEVNLKRKTWISRNMWLTTKRCKVNMQVTSQTQNNPLFVNHAWAQILHFIKPSAVVHVQTGMQQSTCYAAKVNTVGVVSIIMS